MMAGVFERRNQPPGPAPAPRSQSADQRAVQQEISQLLVELSELAQQISAQLDSRTARLAHLIREADERIERLEAAGGGSPPPQPPAPAPRPEPNQRGPAAGGIAGSTRHSEIYRLADQGRTAQQIAAELGRQSGEIELILALRSRSSQKE
jgi:hypothetical protein